MNIEGEEPVRKVRPSPLRWLHEGARTLLFRAPRWERLETGPALMAFLVLLQTCVLIGLTRLFVDAGAIFRWRSVLAGWASFVLVAWACYVLRPVPVRGAGTAAAPGAAHLLSLLMAQSMCLTVLSILTFAGVERAGWLKDMPYWWQWSPWIVTAIWSALAVIVVMLRAGERHAGRRLVAIGAYALSFVLSAYIVPRPAFWTEANAAEARGEAPAPVFTQEVIEAQAPLLAQRIAALQPQRPGIADMYTLTFAPFEGEEVFRRESRIVSDVMSKRFDAAGRGLQLINHAEGDTAQPAAGHQRHRADDGPERGYAVHPPYIAWRRRRRTGGQFLAAGRGAGDAAGFAPLARRSGHQASGDFDFGLLFGQLDRAAGRRGYAGDDGVGRRSHVVRLRKKVRPHLFWPCRFRRAASQPDAVVRTGPCRRQAGHREAREGSWQG